MLDALRGQLLCSEREAPGPGFVAPNQPRHSPLPAQQPPRENTALFEASVTPSLPGRWYMGQCFMRKGHDFWLVAEGRRFQQHSDNPSSGRRIWWHHIITCLDIFLRHQAASTWG